jgi:hypothetical protein
MSMSVTKPVLALALLTFAGCATTSAEQRGSSQSPDALDGCAESLIGSTGKSYRCGDAVVAAVNVILAANEEAGVEGQLQVWRTRFEVSAQASTVPVENREHKVSRVVLKQGASVLSEGYVMGVRGPGGGAIHVISCQSMGAEPQGLKRCERILDNLAGKISQAPAPNPS